MYYDYYTFMYENKFLEYKWRLVIWYDIIKKIQKIDNIFNVYFTQLVPFTEL